MPTNRTTKSGLAIADHLMEDGETFEDSHRYQAGRWTRPVYSCDDGYWAAGATPPKPTHGADGLIWSKVVSRHDGKTVLWRGTESDE